MSMEYKMTKYIERIHDTATDEITERDYTNTQIAEIEKAQLAAIEELAAMEKMAIAKAALLDKLGLTADEFATLIS